LTGGTARGDALIERILTAGDTDGEVSNDLIGEFYSRGYPVEKLIPLLRSENDETVKTGAFLAEELGAKAAPLMPELMRLLGHRDRNVRYDILDAVLAPATANDGEVIAQAIMLIDDRDPAVRSKTLNFLARADREQLVAGLSHVDDHEISAGLGWLVKVEESAADEQIGSRLVDDDRLVAGSRRSRLRERSGAIPIRSTGLLNRAMRSCGRSLSLSSEDSSESGLKRSNYVSAAVALRALRDPTHTSTVAAATGTVAGSSRTAKNSRSKHSARAATSAATRH
jgi:hypothetical protein